MFSACVTCRYSKHSSSRKPSQMAGGMLSENELDAGEVSCFNLDWDEDIRLSERDCEESEESAGMKLIIFQ
ncbi:hypothetical protein TNCV_1521761 [Trichonephila clavipes]|nr:hypothetical protein TNCV_1521761 [Trichonephila clavipes]